mmetsp:Transcript_6364/g.15310  ORF Transcript_6364/g.15310 Transcript_6364/m.15310 type:complete len:272 (-) Transcript_6364:38-853(-)
MYTARRCRDRHSERDEDDAHRIGGWGRLCAPSSHSTYHGACLRQASGKPPDHSLEVGTLSDGLAQGRVLDEGVAQLLLLDVAVLVDVEELEDLRDRLVRVLGEGLQVLAQLLLGDLARSVRVDAVEERVRILVDLVDELRVVRAEAGRRAQRRVLEEALPQLLRCDLSVSVDVELREDLLDGDLVVAALEQVLLQLRQRDRAVAVLVNDGEDGVGVRVDLLAHGGRHDIAELLRSCRRALRHRQRRDPQRRRRGVHTHARRRRYQEAQCSG